MESALRQSNDSEEQRLGNIQQKFRGFNPGTTFMHKETDVKKSQEFAAEIVGAGQEPQDS